MTKFSEYDPSALEDAAPQPISIFLHLMAQVNGTFTPYLANFLPIRWGISSSPNTNSLFFFLFREGSQTRELACHYSIVFLFAFYLFRCGLNT